MTSKGRHLSILVENTARVTFETIVDLKVVLYFHNVYNIAIYAYFNTYI